MAQFQSPTIQNPQVLNPVDPAIENYMRGLVKPTDHPVLLAMEAEARQNNFPIIDRLAGVFIHTMARSIRAERVFEFGSGYGYSAYWFAKALGSAGKVVCTDGNPDNKIKAERYLSDAGLWHSVDFHTGMAQAIFAQTGGEFDICYNDADKGDYPAIWLMAKDRIRPGGYYIADNALWHGRVALDKFEDIVPGWTEAIQEHNAMIFNDPDFDAFINPTRDGVLVARKKF
jgi:caffeoyl-CoA O-methyltransferase